MEFLDKVGLTKLVELIKAAIKTTDDKAVAAQTAAGAASTSAQAAATAAATAQETADTAQETAEAAQTAATAADGKADKAQTAAEAAQAAATAAEGKADKAQTTAEAAQAAAEAADGKADKAQETAGNAMPKTGGTFTGAVSGVEPTTEANLTTKSYVDGAIASATAGVVVDTAISDADVTSIWNGEADEQEPLKPTE